MFSQEATIAKLIANGKGAKALGPFQSPTRDSWGADCSSTIHDLRDPAPCAADCDTAKAASLFHQAEVRRFEFPESLLHDFRTAPIPSSAAANGPVSATAARTLSSISKRRRKCAQPSINDGFPKQPLQLLWKGKGGNIKVGNADSSGQCAFDVSPVHGSPGRDRSSDASCAPHADQVR